MRFSELQQRLRDLGVKVSERTLHNWARAGIIASSQPTPHRRGRPKEKKYTKHRGRKSNYPVEAVYEAAACWAVTLAKRIDSPPDYSEVKRIKELTYKFFEDIDVIEWREDYAPDGTPIMCYSDYKTDPIFQTYVAAYEKAYAELPMRNRVKVIYHVMTRMNCNKNGYFKRFHPVVGVNKLEKLEENGPDFVTWEWIEPWQYIDPQTYQRYEIDRDDNGCMKFVKQPSSDERFLPYIYGEQVRYPDSTETR